MSVPLPDKKSLREYLSAYFPKDMKKYEKRGVVGGARPPSIEEAPQRWTQITLPDGEIIDVFKQRGPRFYIHNPRNNKYRFIDAPSTWPGLNGIVLTVPQSIAYAIYSRKDPWKAARLIESIIRTAESSRRGRARPPPPPSLAWAQGEYEPRRNASPSPDDGDMQITVGRRRRRPAVTIEDDDDDDDDVGDQNDPRSANIAGSGMEYIRLPSGVVIKGKGGKKITPQKRISQYVSLFYPNKLRKR